MITIVIKKLRYLQTSSIIIRPTVISNRFPPKLVPVWFLILLAVAEVCLSWHVVQVLHQTDFIFENDFQLSLPF
jgi:hypothetical protein